MQLQLISLKQITRYSKYNCNIRFNYNLWLIKNNLIINIVIIYLKYKDHN